MRKTITINVTRKMIREARKNGIGDICANCPLAKAISAAGFSSVSVGAFQFLIPGGFGDLSAPAIAFRRAFDAGKPVNPAKFRLTINA